MKNKWKPMKPEEYELCYPHAADSARGRCCVGHLCGDFEDNWLTSDWWATNGDLQTMDFERELHKVLDELYETILHDYRTLEHWCDKHPEAEMSEQFDLGSYALTMETRHYKYAMRLSTTGHHVYLYAYDKRELKQGPLHRRFNSGMSMG